MIRKQTSNSLASLGPQDKHKSMINFRYGKTMPLLSRVLRNREFTSVSTPTYGAGRRSSQRAFLRRSKITNRPEPSISARK